MVRGITGFGWFTMPTETETYEREYESRFAWRKTRQVANLKQLAEITHSNGADPLKAFPVLFTPSSDDPKDALRWSILMLTYEATECYIFGDFQSCILTCGAVVERILKLEYEEIHGKLPDNGEWTLGRCIYKLNWTGARITREILELAKRMIEPRNNRAHALLEHSDPRVASMGGRERGIEVLSSGHYQIEPYRGDARAVIAVTFEILAKLYKGAS
jgi:hypothetical protein